MLRSILVSLVALVTVLPAAAQVRGTTWGMTRAEVKSAETAELLGEQNGRVFFKDQISGITMSVMYSFTDAGLWQIALQTMEKHTNDNQYILEFEELKRLLTAKYGEPYEAQDSWKGGQSVYKSRPEHHGQAISMGYLVKGAKWRTEDTEIGLIVHGSNFKINLAILYESTAQLEEVKADQEAEKLEKI